MHTYFCPDCRRAHDEPAEAGFRLHVRCLECELAHEIEAAVRRLRDAPAIRAA